MDLEYLGGCGVSSPAAFEALDRSSRAVLYSLQLMESKRKVTDDGRRRRRRREVSAHLRAKAMMELGSRSHTAMGTRSCSYIR